MTDSRHALIIANDRYADQGLKKLRAPAQDAAALAGVLHDARIGDFEVEVVRNASADAMRRHIQRFFNDRRRDDTLLLHFSCHGLKSESGELYFAAGDTEPPLLDATAIPAQFVRGCMSRTKAGRTVLFLDCCYGGAFSRGSSSVRASGDVNVLESFPSDKPAGGRGWAVITASDSMEYAFEGDQLAENSAPRPSVFTHAVVQGLGTGEADLDADGEVSLDDLYDYVYEHVREQNPNQTPKKTVEMRGEFHLAHSRRGRIKIAAVPTPVSLRAAPRKATTSSPGRGPSWELDNSGAGREPARGGGGAPDPGGGRGLFIISPDRRSGTPRPARDTPRAVPGPPGLRPGAEGLAFAGEVRDPAGPAAGQALRGPARPAVAARRAGRGRPPGPCRHGRRRAAVRRDHAEGRGRRGGDPRRGRGGAGARVRTPRRARRRGPAPPTATACAGPGSARPGNGDRRAPAFPAARARARDSPALRAHARDVPALRAQARDLATLRAQARDIPAPRAQAPDLTTPEDPHTGPGADPPPRPCPRRHRPRPRRHRGHHARHSRTGRGGGRRGTERRGGRRQHRGQPAGPRSVHAAHPVADHRRARPGRRRARPARAGTTAGPLLRAGRRRHTDPDLGRQGAGDPGAGPGRPHGHRLPGGQRLLVTTSAAGTSCGPPAACHRSGRSGSTGARSR
ncbi:hypothetical protein SSQG_06924 [Streptomyces viridochromogenes DSM 40736]|uniref:Peptidase C14 caspase domain-containing protein n=1 Tax=Streptomyces viridochromogenes (strain DSM 40736 / JCM 4977 / BCRC 1201 / Tue 494) TaxID=591159 RepID=D9XA16_STRVT|nr:hypothetical protein SSQG_06924 [Streptomyces viridochromogenes DSM 40736]